MAAEFLSRVSRNDKLSVGTDILELEDKMLIESAEGDLLVISNGFSDTGAILLPKRTYLTDEEGLRLYSAFYDLEGLPAGEARIVSPAVVEKWSGGWALRERGRMEIVSPVQASSPDVTRSSPFSVADHLQRVKEQTVVTGGRTNGLLLSDPRGDGDLIITRGEGDHLVLVPRLTHFLGKLGFEKYFNDIYKPYYDCSEMSPGDVWIIEPATVRRVPGGWRLLKKGVLEVREKQTAPLILEDKTQNGNQIEAEPSTPSPERREPSPIKVKYARSLISLAVLFTLAVILWRLLGGPNANPPANIESMPQVAGGTFVMGNNAGEQNERPEHGVVVKGFYIDRYEVSREDYGRFVVATKRKQPFDWANGSYPAGTARLPVTGVDWYDADSYCRWTNKRLPTEEEWELAARGFDGRKYPWGNEWKAGYANAEKASQGLTDVDIFKGASPYGAIGMIGNAWEWTASKLVAYPGGRIPPQELADGKADLRVIRGGSWQSDSTSATTTYRWGWPASGGKDYSNTGFRCVSDGPPAQ